MVPLTGVVTQEDIWLADVESQVQEFSEALDIPSLPVKLMETSLEVLSELDGGTIWLNREAAKSSFSKEELTAALARETVFLARMPMLGKNRTMGLPLEIQTLGNMEKWLFRERRVAIGGEIVNLLLTCKRQPFALLTLYEVEHNRLGFGGRAIYSEYDAMVMELRGQLHERSIPIKRSTVSFEFRVKERVNAEQVVFELFGRELLRLTQAEADAQPGVSSALNAFFDRRGELFEVSTRGSELLISGVPVASLDSPDAATAAVKALRLALSEYNRKLGVWMTVI